MGASVLDLHSMANGEGCLFVGNNVVVVVYMKCRVKKSRAQATSSLPGRANQQDGQRLFVGHRVGLGMVPGMAKQGVGPVFFDASKECERTVHFDNGVFILDVHITSRQLWLAPTWPQQVGQKSRSSCAAHLRTNRSASSISSSNCSGALGSVFIDEFCADVANTDVSPVF